jgi:hypothetical protein
VATPNAARRRTVDPLPQRQHPHRGRSGRTRPLSSGRAPRIESRAAAAHSKAAEGPKEVNEVDVMGSLQAFRRTTPFALWNGPGLSNTTLGKKC